MVRPTTLLVLLALLLVGCSGPDPQGPTTSDDAGGEGKVTSSVLEDEPAATEAEEISSGAQTGEATGQLLTEDALLAFWTEAPLDEPAVDVDMATLVAAMPPASTFHEEGYTDGTPSWRNLVEESEGAEVPPWPGADPSCSHIFPENEPGEYVQRTYTAGERVLSVQVRLQDSVWDGALADAQQALRTCEGYSFTGYDFMGTGSYPGEFSARTRVIPQPVEPLGERGMALSFDIEVLIEETSQTLDRTVTCVYAVEANAGVSLCVGETAERFGDIDADPSADPTMARTYAARVLDAAQHVEAQPSVLASYDVIDGEGYEFEHTVVADLQASESIVDAPPGYTDVKIHVNAHLVGVNRTEGRNAPQRGAARGRLIGLWQMPADGCPTGVPGTLDMEGVQVGELSGEHCAFTLAHFHETNTDFSTDADFVVEGSPGSAQYGDAETIESFEMAENEAPAAVNLFSEDPVAWLVSADTVVWGVGGQGPNSGQCMGWPGQNSDVPWATIFLSCGAR